MTTNSTITGGTSATKARPLCAKATELLNDRDGTLPAWIRSPKSGTEHYTGFSRAKLYELAGAGKIRSVSIREPNQIKGTRLFNLASILAFIDKCEAEANAAAQVAEGVNA